MVEKLLKMVPPHREYVEPFGGGASLLIAKRPAKVETYNDLDEGLVNFFKVLADPELFQEFHRRVQATPYSRQLFNEFRIEWRQEADPVIKAWKWFVVARMSFGGRFGHSWGTVVSESSRGMAGTCSGWLSIIDMLPAIHRRLMRVQIENADWRVVLDRYVVGPSTFVYLDPPYVPETRRDGEYAHEMTLEDHETLVEHLLECPAQCLLSGYAHEVYRPLEEAGWKRLDFETACYAAARTKATGIQGEGASKRMQSRTESIWMNPTTLKMKSKLVGLI